MPYTSMKDISPALKGLKPKITLAQANLIAKWADAMEQAEDGPESPWAAAIAQFKKLYRIEGGRWMKRQVKEGATMRGYFTSGTATVEISALDVDGEKVPVSDLAIAYQEARGEGQGVGGDRQGDGGVNACVCPGCGHEVEHKKGTPCNEIECPECGAAMVGKEAVEEAATKTVDGKSRPRGDFLVAEDPDKPSAWHLPVKVNGKLDRRLVGAAWAALHGGYRGQKYGGPDKAAAIKKLKGIYKAQGWETPGMKEADKLRELLEEALSLLGEEVVETSESQLSESASGHALTLVETEAITGGARAPLLMDAVLIQPGFGNKRDGHYYSREVLKRDADVFKGIKMYTTDHRLGEKSVRTEVSVVRDIVGFTEDGAPIGRIAVHDPDFAEATRNRAKLDTLESLECSILATGKVKKGKVDGQKANIVEAIIQATSVDWVTRGGAGGHAQTLIESGGDDMTDEKEVITEQEEETTEATLSEDQQQKVTYLAESEVKAALEASRLPQQAQARLTESQYLDTEALKTAIEQERAYIKELTGSGRPFAQGESSATDEEIMSEAEYDEAYADIRRRHGLYVQEVNDAS